VNVMFIFITWTMALVVVAVTTGITLQTQALIYCGSIMAAAGTVAWGRFARHADARARRRVAIAPRRQSVPHARPSRTGTWS